MKFTLSWLKDYLDTTATLEQIVDGLIGVGLEVEEVSDKRSCWRLHCRLCHRGGEASECGQAAAVRCRDEGWHQAGCLRRAQCAELA